jgi:hypothetical protein
MSSHQQNQYWSRALTFSAIAQAYQACCLIVSPVLAWLEVIISIFPQLPLLQLVGVICRGTYRFCVAFDANRLLDILLRN